MANSYRNGRHNGMGCLGSIPRRGCRENYPYYTGPCPEAGGGYEIKREYEIERGDERPRAGRSAAMFTAQAPMAVAASGVIPLTGSACDCDYEVNGGVITVREPGEYLATYIVRVPEGLALDSTLTLNVNGVSQPAGITVVGGEGPSCFTCQTLFETSGRASVSLKSSDEICASSASVQPMVTLSLLRLSD